MTMPYIQLKMPGEVVEESRSSYGYSYSTRPANLIGGIPLIQPQIPSGNSMQEYPEEPYPPSQEKVSKLNKIRDAMGQIQESVSKIKYKRSPQVHLLQPGKRTKKGKNSLRF